VVRLSREDGSGRPVPGSYILKIIDYYSAGVPGESAFLGFPVISTTEHPDQPFRPEVATLRTKYRWVNRKITITGTT
jgi:hypothetical protein